MTTDYIKTKDCLFFTYQYETAVEERTAKFSAMHDELLKA